MEEQRFDYHRSVAPMLWVLAGISILELLLVHLLVSLLLNAAAAALLSLFTAAGVIWLGVAIVAMKRRPVLLDAERLVMRVGTFKSVTIPVSTIAGLRTEWDAQALKARTLLKLSLVAYPNVIFDLTEPRPGRHGIIAIAHRLDDPAAFVAAIERLSPAPSSR